MKNILFLFAVLIFTNCYAQKNSKATKNNSGDLVGVADRKSFNQEPYTKWFVENYESCTVDKITVSKLKKSLKDVKIKAFMGTWCGDSKREIPHLYKLLEATKFNLKNLEIITVNRAKITPDSLQKGFDISKVPTFIFYKEEKEIGRYVEYARESLEKDIFKIVTGKKYKHSYEK